MKKICSLIISLCMVIAALPIIPASAAASTELLGCIIAAEDSNRVIRNGEIVNVGVQTAYTDSGTVYADVQSVSDTFGGDYDATENGFRLSINKHFLAATADTMLIDSASSDLALPVYMDGRWYLASDVFAALGFEASAYPTYHMVSIGKVFSNPEDIIKLFGVYVSNTGSNSGKGYPYDPVATIMYSRDVARANKSVTNSYGLCEYIFVKAGKYSTFSMNSADYGTEEYPLHIAAFGDGEAKVSTTVDVPSSRFTISTDSRIPQAAKGQVYEADVSDLIGTYTEFPTSLNSQGSSTTGYYQLYENNVHQDLAHYPNSGWMTVSSVTDENTFTSSDSIVSNWTDASDLVLEGYWGYDWAYQAKSVESISGSTVNLSGTTFFGITAGQRFRAINLLEELDISGEWYIDSSTKKLYYYPQNGAPENVELAVDTSEAIRIYKGSEHIRYEGLTFEKLRCGIIMGDVDDTVFDGCTFRGIGSDAIYAYDVTGLQVLNCDLSELGGAGVKIDSTDDMLPVYRTLESTNIRIENNKVHTYNQTFRTVAGGIVVGRAVDGRIRNNVIYDSPHSGIYFGGNDMIVENNEIYDVLQETTDSGAIYTCVRDYSCWGSLVKGNYIHDIPKIAGATKNTALRMGIYLDDMTSGVTIKDNVVDGCTRAAMNGGGWSNVFDGNVFVDCDFGWSMDDRASVTRNSSNSQAISIKTGGETYTKTKTAFDAIAADSELLAKWTARYPVMMGEFRTMFNKWGGSNTSYDIGKPKYNTLTNNVFAGANVSKSTYTTFYSKFTSDGNSESGTVKQKSTDYDYSDLIKKAGNTEISEYPLTLTEFNLSNLGHDVSDLKPGLELSLSAEFNADDDKNYDVFVAFHTNGKLLSLKKLEGLSADRELKVSTDLTAPTGSDENTGISVYAWEKDTQIPASGKNVMPDKSLVEINKISLEDGIMTVAGRVYPQLDGKNVMLRVTNPGSTWEDALSNAKLIQKIDQTTTDDNGRFEFVFKTSSAAEEDGTMQVYVTAVGITAQGSINTNK